MLDVDGRPIPGLWAAGNTGAAMGALYPADGANLGEALCFGRLAAESAARTLGRTGYSRPDRSYSLMIYLIA